MVGEDAGKIRGMQETNVSLIPRFAAIQGPEKLLAIDHDNGVVRKRIHSLYPMGKTARDA